jgi:hypothetical protein
VPVLALAAIWYGLHALNHAFDTDEARSEARGWLDTGLIALGAVVAAYLAWVAARLNAQRELPGSGRGAGETPSG